MYLFFAISGLVNFITSSVLGLLIYFKNRKNVINKTFGLFCICVSLWSFFYIFWPLSETREGTLLSFRLLHLSTFFLSPLYLHFVSVFLDKYDKNKKLIYFGYIVATIFLLFSFSPLFIKGMVPKFSMRYWADIGILYHIYVAQLFGYMIYSNYLLYIEYRKSVGIKRSQIRYILIGIIILYISGGTNYALFYNINFPPYLNILSSSFVFATAYAIVVHRLMDIKLVMRKYSVYLVSLITILLAAIGVKYMFDRYFSQYADWADFFILVGSISVFPSLRGRFYHLANKYFFSSLYDARQVIAELSDKLRSTLDVERIYEYISSTLINAFHIKAVGILNYNEKTDTFGILYNNGFDTKGQVKFPNDKELFNLFIARGQSIVVEEIKHDYYKKHKNIIDLLINLKVEMITPLNIKNKTIGLIALGAKESGDMYNDEDLQVMKVVGAQAAIAMENALLYKETKSFNIKLEKEVERATRDLRKANVQLKKLDEAKSEFISIASHQLRTPLTIIKGYISMMLEGNFGTLTDGEKDSLEKVFESNERLINLVENLLNISRIESGRLQFDFTQADLGQMAASVAEELSPYAKKRNLYLDYKQPVKPLPKIKIDDEKIRQVMMNLVDNAIKYTKQGGVTVKLSQTNKRVRFTVADTGMGIKPEEMSNLFKKFSRGMGTKLVHTEGTGLGLYVARMMIEAHHGAIWAESDGVGRGSRFIFEIPVNV